MEHYKAPLVLALLGLAAASVVSRDDRAKETHITLALDWAMNWGTWGPQEFCPEGTFAYAFEIKVEPEDSNDDTSMNGIQLYCRLPMDAGHDGLPPRKGAREFSITSNVARWGNWRGMRSCTEGLLTGLKMKSEEDQGFFVDDTAANDLEMQCNHSTTTLNGGGNHWGFYSSWATCPEGWAICGLMTRVEAESATDDTALNDVRMYCCQV
ncbi:vitelline membrane outer layer protein 1-like [Portunus trituberculatus]|nr:vitelline membrane outer layer protein 1-like [Portunus trituberculatus]